MGGKTIFPQNNAEFFNWADNFREGIQDTATSDALNLPSLAEQIMTAHWEDFEQWHEKYIVQKDKSGTTKAQYFYYRELVETDIRTIYNQYIKYNPAATPALRQKLGLRAIDDVKTPIEMTTAAPYVEVGILANHRVKLAIKADASHRAKPKGVEGVEIREFVGVNPPANADEFVEILK
ncbi:MAG: hypothetical protein LBO06_03675, partial [Bacteroidales bacterium]|nr:hypothetical protein [Bacteroidales bacterium]